MRVTLPAEASIPSTAEGAAIDLGVIARRYESRAVEADAWPGAAPPVRPDAWLVTDEHAELRSELRRMAAEHGLVAHAGDVVLEARGTGGTRRARAALRSASPIASADTASS